ncbi:MAG: hypothetical protein Alpg2KO_25900 [Alphaproteobacteria bacterium]
MGLEEGEYWGFVYASWGIALGLIALLFVLALISRKSLRRRWAELEALKRSADNSQDGSQS